MNKVGIREFRENLAAIMDQDAPVAVTRHGETVGFYIPAKRKPKEADWAAIRQLGAKVDAMLEAAGVTEDELVEEFERLRRADRNKRTERIA
jgi:antitoxin (DNA-binding transcriptional repressor) of toxin-antitoxin stability system